MKLAIKSTEPLLQLTYEIYNNDKIFSKLEFEDFYRFRNRATATIDGEQLDLGSLRAINPNKEIKDSKTQKVIAKYSSKIFSSKGTLTINEKIYILKQSNSGKLEYAWISGKGEETITYQLEGFMLNKGEIHISPEMEKDSNLKLLVVVGLYIIMLGGRWHTQASTSAIIAISTVFIFFIFFIFTLIAIFYLQYGSGL